MLDSSLPHSRPNFKTERSDPNAQALAVAEALNARVVRVCHLGRCVSAPPELVRAHWPISNVDNWRALLLAAGRTNAQGVRRG